MRGRAGIRVAGALAAALAATMLVAPAGAAEKAAGAAEEDSVWKVDVWGHPFEPYAQIPEELQAGSTGTWSQLEGALPTRCEALGTLVDTGGGGVTVDMLAYELSDRQYENPTTAHSANPETRFAPKAEKATFPNGPTAKSECSSPTSGTASATWGRYLSEQFSFEGSSSDTTNRKVDGTLVTETTNKVHGLKVGKLSIGTVLSWLKVEYKASQEPTISYRIELSNVTDGQSNSGAGATGIALAGQGLAGKDVPQQFNGQVKGGQGSFKTLGKYGLRLVEPRVGYSKSHRYVVEVSALDGLIGFAARQNQIGEGFGFRVGVSRSAGRYELVGTPPPTEGYTYMDDPTFGFY
ncbi:MAG TPA: hypothetical protein VFS16_12845 [Acidimicrobiia bacterium]|nr:hypothetical protein [Acidimicrobiia bacterium]